MNDGFATVYSLYSFNNNLFAGGNFYAETSTKPVDETSRNLQVFNDNGWGRVDGWKVEGVIGRVFSMAVYKNELYIVGTFLEKYGSLANGIIKYDGTYFYKLGDGIDNFITDMVVHKNELFICGAFSYVDGIKASCIAKWNGERFCSLSNENFGNYVIEDMAIYHDTLHILGGFQSISGQNLSTLVKWIGNPKMEGSCAAPADLKKVNYNLSLNENELTKLKFNIYPNPVSNILVVEKLKNAGIFDYSIMDITGKEIINGSIINSKTEINVSGISEGIYIIELFNEKEKLSKKIRIEKK